MFTGQTVIIPIEQVGQGGIAWQVPQVLHVLQVLAAAGIYTAVPYGMPVPQVAQGYASVEPSTTGAVLHHQRAQENVCGASAMLFKDV